MAEKYYPPQHATDHFHCPHCGVYAQQNWSHLNSIGDLYSRYNSYGNPTHSSSIIGLPTQKQALPENWTISFCQYCSNFAIWLNDQMVYPKKIIVDRPNDDLSEDIKSDYLEAANILSDSPRAAAALLRLVLQKLCKELGERGENINDDIASLVKKDPDPLIQKALDSLRIAGNNGVHPGEINLKEEPEKVQKLFWILNFIAQRKITEPKDLVKYYDDLPEEAKEAVKKRDLKVVVK